jgi:photosystem II stability/assembly factor-like uncharacterized protein
LRSIMPSSYNLNDPHGGKVLTVAAVQNSDTETVPGCDVRQFRDDNAITQQLTSERNTGKSFTFTRTRVRRGNLEQRHMKEQYLLCFCKRWFVGILALLSAILSAALEVQGQAVKGPSRAEDQVAVRRRHLEEILRDHCDASGHLRQDLWLQGIEHFKRMKTLTGQWQQIGPQPLIDGAMPNLPLSGLVWDIAIDPRGTTDQWIYIATDGGGVWKSTNGGKTWVPKTDSMPSNFIGAVALDPVNPSTVYAGTGALSQDDRFFPGNRPFPFFTGIGVYRSTDGGETWTIPGGTLAQGNPLFNGRGIVRVVVLPATLTSPSALIVGGSDLFKSIDGGDHYGNNPPNFDNGQPVLTGGISDIDVDTITPGVVYACIAGVGLFRSMDSGSTFDPNNLFTTPVAGAPPLPAPGYLSFAQSTQPNNLTMYLNVQLGATNVIKIFRSDNGGSNWAECQGPQGGQGGYDQTIGVDPQNADRVYAGLVDLIKSENRGASFSLVSKSKTHADHHAMVFSPKSHVPVGPPSPTRIWVGTDGGVFFSDDGAASFESLNKTIATILFRAIDIGRGEGTVFGIGGQLLGAKRDFTYGGTQDNGTNEHRPNFPGNEWHEGAGDGGDGANAIVDPTNPMRAYGWATGSFLRTTDGGDTWSGATLLPDNTAFAGIPVAVDPNNTDWVYAVLGNQLFRSKNATGTNPTFSAIPVRGNSEFPSAPAAVSLSPNSDSMWIARAGGVIERTDNLRADKPTWTAHTMMGNAPLGLPFGGPQGIAVDPTNPDRAVVVFTSFTSDSPVTPARPAVNRTRHVFLIERQVVNGIETFTDTDISGIDGGDPEQNLPDLPVYAVVIDSNPDPKTGQQPIIVATEAGVLRTNDAGRKPGESQRFDHQGSEDGADADDRRRKENGAHWKVLGTGLPIVRCKSLAIDSSVNPALLRVGTYGRSAFELTHKKHQAGNEDKDGSKDLEH